jgi:hypothetical protein
LFEATPLLVVVEVLHYLQQETGMMNANPETLKKARSYARALRENTVVYFDNVVRKVEYMTLGTYNRSRLRGKQYEFIMQVAYFPGMEV